MSYELNVLRALFRATLSNRRPKTHPVQVDDLQGRVGGELDEVRRAVVRLARAGLVQRSSTGPRLTLAGLAIAASLTGPVTKSAKASEARAAGRVRGRVAGRIAPAPHRSRAA